MCPRALVFGKITWRFRLFSGRRIKVQPPEVEVDRVDEVLFIPESGGEVLHPLDLRMECFTSSIDVASKVMMFSNRRFSIAAFSFIVSNRLRTAQLYHHRKCLRRLLIHLVEKRHGGLLEGPGARAVFNSLCRSCASGFESKTWMGVWD